MDTRLTKEDAFQITDSTDWLTTPLTSLSPVDAALRCQVCKDFYTTPMITSCAHTFCSLCIRRCLSNDGQCPACRAKDQEFKLRFNGAMEELVQAFVKARPAVLGFAKEGGRAGTPKRRRDELEEEDGDLKEEEEMPRKRTRASSKKQPPTRSSQRIVVLDSDDDIDEYIPDGTVKCPICNNQVKETLINTHLDSGCSDPLPNPRKPTPLQIQKPQPSKLPTKPLERLASPNYSMLKDGPLRKRLTDHGLSAAGSRQLLVQRHTEWITLWNANCDATKPKTKGELKREMDVWERTQGGQARPRENHLAGAQIKDKDFDGAAWSSKHDGDFKTLIENARRKVVKPFSTTPSLSGNGNGDQEVNTETTPTTDIEMGSATPEVEVVPNPSSSLPLRETSLERRRFFQEDGEEDETAHPPSSQYQRDMSVEKEAFISDIASSSRVIQP